MMVAWSRRGCPELSLEAFASLLRQAELRYFVHDVGLVDPGIQNGGGAEPWPHLPQIDDVQLAAVNATCTLRHPDEVARLRQLVVAASERGARAVNLHVIHILGEFDPLPSFLTEALCTLGDQAQACGLDLCLDSTCGLGGTRQGMARTIKALNHPAIKLQLDCGGYVLQNPGSQFEIAIQRLIGWTGSLRLSDMVDGNSEADYPPLGWGASVDFARVWQLLRGMNLNIPCEIYFHPADQKAGSLQQITRNLRESLRTLRDCGWPVTVPAAT